MVSFTAGWWVRSATLKYAGSAVGIVLAAVVSSRVSVTVAGVAAGAALLSVFSLLVAGLLVLAARHKGTLWAVPAVLFLAAPALVVASLLVAAHVVPGFDVHGAWGYVVLLVLTFGASQALGWLASQLAPVASENS